MATNRYRPPLYLASLEEQQGRALERIPFDEREFYEDWLQERLFKHPEVLPFGEIDPSFGPVMPLCRELPTNAGYLDVAYVGVTGRIALVECKLWRSPEARREVVGQILDYAKELALWDYERLSRAVGSATRRSGDALWDIAAAQDPNLDQAVFVDDVTRNLEEGRFLLLIVGDGIREGVESIAAFLQSQPGLRFSFSLVEMAVYRMPSEPGGFLMQPRVLARTVEIERFVVRREGEGVAVEDIAGGEASGESESGDGAGGTRTRLPKMSLKEIYEKLDSVKPGLGADAEAFIERCKSLDIHPSVKRTLVLRYADPMLGNLNFGTIHPYGGLDTNYICYSAEWPGDLSVGEDYLAGIAKFIPGAGVSKKGHSWTWRVTADGSDKKRLPPVETVLQHSDEWFELIEKTLARFKELSKQQEEKPD